MYMHIIIVIINFTYISCVCLEGAQLRHACLGIDGDDYRVQCLVPVVSTGLVLIFWLYNQTGDLYTMYITEIRIFQCLAMHVGR